MEILVIEPERKCAVCNRILDEDEEYRKFQCTPELEDAIHKYMPELDMDKYLEILVLCEPCHDLPEHQRRSLSADAVRMCDEQMSEEHKDLAKAIVATVMGQIH